MAEALCLSDNKQVFDPASYGLVLSAGVPRTKLIWRIRGLDYWHKLRILRVYSQKRRRERFMIIILWKLNQGLFGGYDIAFTPTDSRTGRKAVLPANVSQTTGASECAFLTSFKNSKLFELYWTIHLVKIPLNLAISVFFLVRSFLAICSNLWLSGGISGYHWLSWLSGALLSYL